MAKRKKKKFKFDTKKLRKSWDKLRADKRVFYPLCGVLALVLLFAIDIPGRFGAGFKDVPSAGGCSADKECVWRTGSFLLLSEADPSTGAGSLKWDGNLKIQIVGDQAEAFKPQIGATLDQARLTFPRKINTVAKGWNVVMVVTNDFNKSFKVHGPALEATFGKTFSKLLKAENKGVKKNKCVSLGIRNKETKMRMMEVLFVNPEADPTDCMLNTLLFNSDTYSKQGVMRFTELHHLLVSMVYDKRMAKAKTPEEVRKAFDKIYPGLYKKLVKNFPAPVAPPHEEKEYDVNPELLN